MTRIAVVASLLAVLLSSCGGSPDAPSGDAGSQPARTAPDTRRIHALIVGIDRYRHSDAQLDGAVF